MKIHDDHLYHGAALIQVAEHPTFKAINSMKVNGVVSRSAFQINQDIGLYLKYAVKPMKSFDEYQFTFTEKHLEDLKLIADSKPNLFIALVCVEGREICVLSHRQLQELVKTRRASKGESEPQYIVLATMKKNQAFRVYVNKAGIRKYFAGKPLVVPRNSFPALIFG